MFLTFSFNMWKIDLVVIYELSPVVVSGSLCYQRHIIYGILVLYWLCCLWFCLLVFYKVSICCPQISTLQASIKFCTHGVIMRMLEEKWFLLVHVCWKKSVVTDQVCVLSVTYQEFRILKIMRFQKKIVLFVDLD